jgi:hypothetical protein
MQALLRECNEVIADADWATLRNVLPRISGNPNNAKENMDAVVALLEDGRAADRASMLTSEFLEYLDTM